MLRKTATYSAALGQNVKAARVRLDLKQAQCAARMRALGYDWHQQTVGNVERATRRITAEELLGLCLALECAFTELLVPGVDVGTVVLPSGGQLPRLSVARLATAINDGTVQWEDDKPRIRTGPPPAISSDELRSQMGDVAAFLDELRQTQVRQQGRGD